MYLEVEFRRVACRSCGLVKQEKLSWIAGNPLYTNRFAFFVGRRCRAATLKDVAKELHLDWQTVKRLEDAYRFPGFRPSRWVRGVFGDSQVRIMVLEREQKKRLAAFAVKSTVHSTTARYGPYEIFPAGIRACI